MQKVTLLALNLQSWLEQVPRPSSSHVKTLLKAKQTQVASFDDNVNFLYAYLGGRGTLPLAALLAHRYRLPPGLHWLIVEPIECEERDNRIHCSGSEHLGMTRDEVNLLMDSMNAHLESEGLRLYAPEPDRWLLSMKQPLDVSCMPLAEALHRDMNQCVPPAKLKDWKRLFVEFQMLLHQHPVNRLRVQNAKPKINACWFSGGGELPVMNSQPKMALMSDEPLARTLGDWVSALSAPLAQHYEEALTFCDKETEHLLIDTDCESLAAFEKKWLGPVMSALSERKIQEVEIQAGANLCYAMHTQQRIKLPFLSKL